MEGGDRLTSMPDLEHCKSTVTLWKASNRTTMHTTKIRRKYLLGFLGRFRLEFARAPFRGPNSSSYLPFAPGSQSAK